MAETRRRWIVSGGIGSGKSAVRRLLDEFGFYTVDADSVGHEVLSRSGPAYRDVVRRWPEVLDADGEIDRAELGAIVFSDPAALNELERMTHPHIFGIILDRVQGIPDSVAVEVPLLNHRLGTDWDRVIVDCTDQVRLGRLVDRGRDIVDAEARMAAQPGRGEWLAIADLILPNHGDLTSLKNCVAELVKASPH